MTLLAIDPGKRIGYALFEDDGTEVIRSVVDWRVLRAGLLSLEGVRTVVVENYRGRPGKSRGGQEFEAAEVIGAVRFWAESNGIEFLRQEPSILPVAKAWAGYSQKVKHLPDQDSAFLHGRYYLVRTGVLQPVPLDC